MHAKVTPAWIALSSRYIPDPLWSLWFLALDRHPRLLLNLFQTDISKVNSLRCSAGSMCLHSPSPWWMSLADLSHNTVSLLCQHCCLPQTLLPLNPPLQATTSFLATELAMVAMLFVLLKNTAQPSFTDCGLSHTMDCVRCFQPTCTLISVERGNRSRTDFHLRLIWTDFFNRWNGMRAHAHTHKTGSLSDHMEKFPLISSINVLQCSTSTVEQKLDCNSLY